MYSIFVAPNTPTQAVRPNEYIGRITNFLSPGLAVICVQYAPEDSLQVSPVFLNVSSTRGAHYQLREGQYISFSRIGVEKGRLHAINARTVSSNNVFVAFPMVPPMESYRNVMNGEIDRLAAMVARNDQTMIELEDAISRDNPTLVRRYQRAMLVAAREPRKKSACFRLMAEHPLLAHWDRAFATEMAAEDKMEELRDLLGATAP